MENELHNKDIEKAISELETSLGVKEPVSGEEVFALIRSGDTTNAIKLIAQQLDLPVSIDVTIVPNDYRAQNGSARFHSTQLVKSKRHGVSSEGITAQVLIPPNLPFYGTQALTNYPITVKISQNCTNHPVVFMTIMAHELSHVLLHSLGHAKKDDEFYTDLTAIMLGFASVYEKGRKITKVTEDYSFAGTTTTTQTTTYGYLNDAQFSFAYDTVFSILKKNRSDVSLLSDWLQRFERLSKKHNEVLFKFKRYFDYVIKNKATINISGEDGKAILKFFQADFMGGFTSQALRYTKDIATIQLFLNNIEHYTEQSTKILHAHVDALKSYCESLNVGISDIRNHMEVLGRYVDYKYRFETFFAQPEEMHILTCTSCGQLLRVTHAGAASRCPKCKTILASTTNTAPTVANDWRAADIITRLRRLETRDVLLATGALLLLSVIAWAFAGQHPDRFPGRTTTPVNGVEGVVNNVVQSQNIHGQPLMPLPDNGAIRMFTVLERIAPFKISAGPSGHNLIKLLNSSSKKEVMTIFVRSGQTTEVKVPLGSYEIRIASGRDWYGYLNGFGRAGSYSKSDQLFVFNTEGDYVRGHSISLSEALNGNMRIQEISADEF